MKENLLQFILNLTHEEVDILMAHLEELKESVNKGGAANA